MNVTERLYETASSGFGFAHRPGPCDTTRGNGGRVSTSLAVQLPLPLVFRSAAMPQVEPKAPGPEPVSPIDDLAARVKIAESYREELLRHAERKIARECISCGVSTPEFLVDKAYAWCLPRLSNYKVKNIRTRLYAALNANFKRWVYAVEPGCRRATGYIDAGIENLLVRREDRDTLHAILSEALGPDNFETLLLAYSRMTHQAIAESMGMKRHAITRRVLRTQERIAAMRPFLAERIREALNV